MKVKLSNGGRAAKKDFALLQAKVIEDTKFADQPQLHRFQEDRRSV
jgi:hypothetical protein